MNSLESKQKEEDSLVVEHLLSFHVPIHGVLFLFLHFAEVFLGFYRVQRSDSHLQSVILYNQNGRQLVENFPSIPFGAQA